MNARSSHARNPLPRDRSVPPSHTIVLFRSPAFTVTTRYVDVAGRRYPLSHLEAPRRMEHVSWWQPRAYELLARCQGQVVRLFRSRDVQEFNQACRALVRAREYAGLA